MCKCDIEKLIENTTGVIAKELNIQNIQIISNALGEGSDLKIFDQEKDETYYFGHIRPFEYEELYLDFEMIFNNELLPFKMKFLPQSTLPVLFKSIKFSNAHFQFIGIKVKIRH